MQHVISEYLPGLRETCNISEWQYYYRDTAFSFCCSLGLSSRNLVFLSVMRNCKSHKSLLSRWLIDVACDHGQRERACTTPLNYGNSKFSKVHRIKIWFPWVNAHDLEETSVRIQYRRMFWKKNKSLPCIKLFHSHIS